MESYICIFGDSIAWGAWDQEKGGWVNRLWLTLCNHEPYVELYNLSISGGSTETLLARFESEANVRHATHLIFQTGGNDAAYEVSPEKPQVDPEKFRANLEAIIRKAKVITPNILLLGGKGADEANSMPVSWVNLHYANESIERYNRIMKEVCEKNGVLYLELFGLLNDGDFEDGVHPNTDGHRKIFEKVQKFLIEQEWI